MINKRIVLLSLILLPFLVMAQGVNFENISLEEALSKAKSENKLVFIDFYTAWCGPCKKMVKNIFPLPEVGEFYNKNFINLKLDAEKGGAAVAQKYNVTGYPTLLYLDTDGKVLLKDSAYKPEDIFIDMGKRAIASLNSTYSLENLQEMFPNKLNDEQFLKTYIAKMKGFGQDTSQGIDAWLKVQTEMDESSPEMLNFILRNARNFTVGGKGEQILKDNYDMFMKLASNYQAKMLPRLSTQILNGTMEIALKRKDPNLLKAYIEAYKNQPQDRIHEDDLLEAELIYYSMIQDDASYKVSTANYITNLINNSSIDDIQEADQKSYEMYKRAYDEDPKPAREPMLKASKAGLKAFRILKDLNKFGKGYVKRANTKNELKVVNSWIKYGYKLKANNCYIDDLKAELLYKKGKNKKAIEFKEKAINNWPKTDKKYVNKPYELEQFKKKAS